MLIACLCALLTSSRFGRTATLLTPTSQTFAYVLHRHMTKCGYLGFPHFHKSTEFAQLFVKSTISELRIRLLQKRFSDNQACTRKRYVRVRLLIQHRKGIAHNRSALETLKHLGNTKGRASEYRCLEEPEQPHDSATMTPSTA